MSVTTRRGIPAAIFFGLAVVLLSIQSAGAQDLDRGQALYENHCQACHEDWAHTRQGRKVSSREELQRRVAAWSIHAGLPWTREEIDAVTRYLDARFYRFED